MQEVIYMKAAAGLLLVLCLSAQLVLAGNQEHSKEYSQKPHKMNPQMMQLQQEYKALHEQHKQLESEMAALKLEWEKLQKATGGAGPAFEQHKAVLMQKKDNLMARKKQLHNNKMALEAKKQSLQATKSL